MSYVLVSASCTLLVYMDFCGVYSVSWTNDAETIRYSHAKKINLGTARAAASPTALR